MTAEELRRREGLSMRSFRRYIAVVGVPLMSMITIRWLDLDLLEQF